MKVVFIKKSTLLLDRMFHLMKSWIDSINFSHKKSLNEIFVAGINFVNCQIVINKTASSRKIEFYKIETCVFDKVKSIAKKFDKIKTSHFWQDRMPYFEQTKIVHEANFL